MDTIGNMIAQIANANHKFKESIDVPVSKVKVEIAKVLKEEGFISNYRVAQDKKTSVLKVTMKYTAQKERVIQGVKRVSTPGLRVYKKWTEIPSIKNGLGTAVISTSKGLLSSQKAREKKLGGEVICYIW
ncbi:MAG: 30S ribosomal protein S8 [Elusimicrobiota bacterium]